jgi:hypothetical protein
MYRRGHEQAGLFEGEGFLPFPPLPPDLGHNHLSWVYRYSTGTVPVSLHLLYKKEAGIKTKINEEKSNRGTNTATGSDRIGSAWYRLLQNPPLLQFELSL